MSLFKKEGLLQPHRVITLNLHLWLQNRMQMFNNSSKVADRSCDVKGSYKGRGKVREIKNSSLTKCWIKRYYQKRKNKRMMFKDIILNHYKK